MEIMEQGGSLAILVLMEGAGITPLKPIYGHISYLSSSPITLFLSCQILARKWCP